MLSHRLRVVAGVPGTKYNILKIRQLLRGDCRENRALRGGFGEIVYSDTSTSLKLPSPRASNQHGQI